MNSGEIPVSTTYSSILTKLTKNLFCLDKQGSGLLPRQEKHDSKKSPHHSSHGVVIFFFFLLVTRKADRHIRSGAYYYRSRLDSLSSTTMEKLGGIVR